MTDRFTPQKRSAIMASVRNKGTQPEKELHAVLSSCSLRFEKHPPDVYGEPDVILRSPKIAFFVHGCFWHGHRGCSRATLPKTNRSFWRRKITANVRRHSQVVRKLRSNGWSIVVLWTCQGIRRDLVLSRLMNVKNSPKLPISLRKAYKKG
jgi:DNA mismatch endonuclease (patch repair protein)